MRLSVGIVACVFAVCVGAETEYESVDAEGNVTFSDQIPANAVRAKTIAIEPGPSAEEVRKAEEQPRAVEQDVEDTDEQRATAAKQRAATSIAEAETVWVDSQPEPLDSRGQLEPRRVVIPRDAAESRGPMALLEPGYSGRPAGGMLPSHR
jgi:hypothetical protein